VRAVNRIIKFGVKEINEEKLLDFLDTSGLPEPDLIIRTSGEKRTSGFMPFQSTYAEWYFADVHFPDFDACELKKAVEDFAKRKRNFGK
jgi:undecaprenyl diphosphate synthase